MNAPERRTGTAWPRALAVVGSVAAALGAVVLVVTGLHLVGQVRDQADEYAWLRTQPTISERVVEVEDMYSPHQAKAVYVAPRGEPEAFISMEGSKQQVSQIGQSVNVKIDARESPAVSSGVAADAVNRSFRGEYVRKSLPFVGAAALAGIAWWLSRRTFRRA
ncbi:hypothetical protein GCM10025864_11700 [Luteimicrobium album]|uniref:DUF3592 domain-containing protein n=1 Tax=Luteimicrobium album TaxID=1054550 RepID=A0ABQ6HY33_9MICO|nr:hypothetical protein [Luteimicrobium album]GMA23411.1 hypothetical protein GCM10025864_11700 [Luteimicrobium album]